MNFLEINSKFNFVGEETKYNESSYLKKTEDNYKFPYKNPIRATATVALLQSKYPNESRYQVLRITTQTGRSNVKYLEGRDSVPVHFYKNKNKTAPLIVFMPGLASIPEQGSAKFIAENFHENGYHVLVMPSTFHWSFALAASKTGLPGITTEDAKDMYYLIKVAYAKISKQISPKSFGLMGISMGALQVPFVAKLASEDLEINFEKVLSVNPPGDLLNAMGSLDKLLYVAKDWSLKRRKQVGDRVFAKIMGMLGRDFNDPDYFKNLDKKVNLTDDELMFAIGGNFRTNLANTAVVSQLVVDMGILQTPMSEPYIGKRVNEAMMRFGFYDYFLTFVKKHLEQNLEDIRTMNSFEKRNSLYGMKDFLLGNEKMYLMHNRDDFLIDEGDLKYFSMVYGDRATFYPYGGHIGNLWYPENRQKVQEIFSSLK